MRSTTPVNVTTHQIECNAKRTRYRLRKRLENDQRPSNDPKPPLLQARRNHRPIDLQQLAQRKQTQLLVVHARQLVLGIDCREPLVEKEAGSARLVVLHQVQRRSRVVKDGVDEDDEVGEFEGIGVTAVDVVDGDFDDILEVLQERTVYQCIGLDERDRNVHRRRDQRG